MVNIKNFVFLTYLKGKKRLRRLNGLTLVLVFVLALTCTLILKFSSQTNDEYKTRENRYFSDIDLNINTSRYVSDYEQFKAKHEQTKQLLDEASSTLGKRVVYNARSESSIRKADYLIVEFTRVFGSRKFCLNENSSSMYLAECPFKNCHFTCDRSSSRRADAFLFHAFDLLHESTETRVYIKKFLANLPNRREQIWILWHDEV